MRPILDALDRAFVSIDERRRQLLLKIPNSRSAEERSAKSVALVVRSAAVVEMTFGGITTKLWDDPFEWTLPEHLSDPESVLRYLDEVEVTRRKGFAYLTSDADLAREIQAPRKLRPLIDVLIETITRAEHFQGRAFGILESAKAGGRNAGAPLRRADR